VNNNQVKKLLEDEEIERFRELYDAGLLTSPDELFQGRLLATIDALRAELLRVRADIGLNEGDFEAVWEAYALADDDTLDTNALALKRKLRSIVGIDALKAELSDARHRERLSIETVCAYEAGQADGAAKERAAIMREVVKRINRRISPSVEDELLDWLNARERTEREEEK
jgi:hypothetical protein